MPAGFELFDHTADIGIRAWAPTLAELFETAARGMYHVIGDLIPEGQPRRWSFDASGSDRADLLRKFLAELLYAFERDHQFALGYEVRVMAERTLHAQLQMGIVDWNRSELNREVKAITYHELAVEETAAGFEARVIVDI